MWTKIRNKTQKRETENKTELYKRKRREGSK